MNPAIQRSLRVLAATAVGLMLSFSGSVHALNNASQVTKPAAQAAYDDWVHRCALTREQWFGYDQSPLLVAITQVEDEKEQGANPFRSLPPRGGYKISVRGVAEWFYEDDMK